MSICDKYEMSNDNYLRPFHHFKTICELGLQFYLFGGTESNLQILRAKALLKFRMLLNFVKNAQLRKCFVKSEVSTEPQ